MVDSSAATRRNRVLHIRQLTRQRIIGHLVRVFVCGGVPTAATSAPRAGAMPRHAVSAIVTAAPTRGVHSC
ncbi:hypothetical protein D5R55_26270 [Burkholderia cenocepacia]|uniref:Uncharacterized protein n=1 Tax=Burkholderia cenocepacia TaxID=95486 RepID=A0A3Q9FBM3_9BURK|nr:hypothetical protein D5R55_26270 [Burkholderia cenocepacia]